MRVRWASVHRLFAHVAVQLLVEPSVSQNYAVIALRQAWPSSSLVQGSCCAVEVGLVRRAYGEVHSAFDINAGTHGL